jgi:hypothetical protein
VLGIWNQGFEVEHSRQVLEFGIWNPEFGIWNLKKGI